jgi:hypothetical protein
MIKIALNIFIVVIFVFVFNNIKKDVMRYVYQVFEGFTTQEKNDFEKKVNKILWNHFKTNQTIKIVDLLKILKDNELPDEFYDPIKNMFYDENNNLAKDVDGTTMISELDKDKLTQLLHIEITDPDENVLNSDSTDSEIQECAKNCLKPEFITGNCQSEIITKETTDGKKYYRHCPYRCMNKYDKDYVNYDQSGSDKPYILERDGCRYSQQCNDCGKELIEVNEEGVGLKKHSALNRKFTPIELTALQQSRNGAGANNNMGINNLANQSEAQYNSSGQPKQNINRNTSNMYGNNPEIKDEKYGDYLYENRVSAQLYGDPYTKDYHPQDPNKKPSAYNSLMNLF